MEEFEEFEEFDYDCALPEEIKILSVLPEDKKNFVFQMASKHYCQNLQQWLNHLELYVSGWLLTQGYTQ